MLIVSFSFATAYQDYCKGTNATCTLLLSPDDIVFHNSIYLKSNYFFYYRIQNGINTGTILFDSSGVLKAYPNSTDYINVGLTFNAFSSVSSCPTGQTPNSSGICTLPTLTCTPNQILNPTTKQCDCKPGYFSENIQNEDGTATVGECKPKIDCPPQMQYFWTDQATDITGLFKTTYYTCVPRTDLSEPDCAAQGGTYYSKAKDTSDGTSGTFKYMMMYGEGCVNESWIKGDVFRQDFSFLMSGFILGALKPFPASLANKAVSEKQLLLEYKNKTGDFPLTKYEPVVEDLGIGSDGVVGNVGFYPKNAATDAENSSAFNKWLSDNGYISPTGEVTYPHVNDLGVDPSVASKMGDNFYKGYDVTKFGDNMLGSANMASKGAIPDLAPATSAPVGATVATKIDLSKYLNKTEVQSYPVAVVKQSEKTNVDGSVATVYKGKVTYPDATVADFTVNQTKSSTGTVNEVGYSYIVNTSNGTKTFNGSYTTTTDPTTGAVTNTVNKPSTVFQVNNDGSVSTRTNAGNDSVETDKSPSPINLTNIQNALNQMNKTLTETQTLVKDMIQHVPENTVAFQAALNNFKNGFNDLSLKINNFLDFLNGLPSLFDDLKIQLNDLLALFEDKPTLSLPSGDCPFYSSWYGQTVKVDPCMFVAPYRPILVIFLTFFMSVGVLLFALKFLFNVSLGGK